MLLYIVEKNGKYHVLTGFYASHKDAAGAIRRLPGPLRAGGAFPITVAKLLQN